MPQVFFSEYDAADAAADLSFLVTRLSCEAREAASLEAEVEAAADPVQRLSAGPQQSAAFRRTRSRTPVPAAAEEPEDRTQRREIP
jgi:hypothetical protein